MKRWKLHFFDGRGEIIIEGEDFDQAFRGAGYTKADLDCINWIEPIS